MIKMRMIFISKHITLNLTKTRRLLLQSAPKYILVSKRTIVKVEETRNIF